MPEVGKTKSSQNQPASHPLVWYMAQGYSIRGGHESHILNYATIMREHGFRTKAVVFNPLPREKHLFIRQLKERGIPLTSLADKARIKELLLFAIMVFPWLVWSRAKKQSVRFAQFREYLRCRLSICVLKQEIRGEKPDLIHIFGRLQDNAWDSFPSERTVFHHGTEGKMDQSWNPEEIDNFRGFTRKVARNFAPGSGVIANLRRDFGLKQDIQVIFTMAPDKYRRDTSATTAQGSGTRFGVLCRLTPEKSITHILEAISLFHSQYGQIDFTFAGEGALEYEVRCRLQAMNLPNVRLVTEFDSPGQILRSIDVFVHPSMSDAMPLAIVEALMWGCPVIGSYVGGIPDLIRDGVEGFLVEPGKADQINEAMSQFAEMSPSELDQFRRRARARYEEVCTPEKIGAVVAGHYRSILSVNPAN